ncbi:endonuclease/exonuclease/phosphatase family protein [Marimonas sp. MJW-29]|uniref:Endonuclease/exonuclease/phosphatase family protein n=1 Tax=Sulfitobacter sediminis TaxID=3234186 RepID=A0ABV3RHC8_9RHOB
MGTIGSILLWLLTAFLLAATMLPISKVARGAIRGLDFPRQQYFLLAALLAVCVFIFVPGWLGGLGGPLLILIGAVQLFYILKFTPLWWRQSVDASDALRGQTDRQVSLLAANVKKSNRDYGALIDLVRRRQPDIAMAIEVDAEWIGALKEALSDHFEDWVEVPNDNGYGLCVMSRLALSETEVRDLITRDVPSVRTRVTLRDGEAFRLYVVHPEPPVIDHDTKGRDSEIAMVGLEATRDVLPAIVAGDLNDVAWSTTTRRFQRLSGLLDPRVGRGFFNTFSATMPWMRWPLDHLFHDARFRLMSMARLEKIGSDHFPMWFVLALAQNEKEEMSPGESDRQEKQETKEMIAEEKARDRKPIGTDWEDE